MDKQIIFWTNILDGWILVSISILILSIQYNTVQQLQTTDNSRMTHLDIQLNVANHVLLIICCDREISIADTVIPDTQHMGHKTHICDETPMTQRLMNGKKPSDIFSPNNVCV